LALDPDPDTQPCFEYKVSFAYRYLIFFSFLKCWIICVTFYLPSILAGWTAGPEVGGGARQAYYRQGNFYYFVYQ
jgi:hypothetical protein